MKRLPPNLPELLRETPGEPACFQEALFSGEPLRGVRIKNGVFVEEVYKRQFGDCRRLPAGGKAYAVPGRHWGELL